MKKYPHLVRTEPSTKLKKNAGQMKKIQCKGLRCYKYKLNFENYFIFFFSNLASSYEQINTKISAMLKKMEDCPDVSDVIEWITAANKESKLKLR